MPRPVHFEIHASEPQRLIDFYSEVFGWRFERWGEVPYWVISTGDEDMGINGGLTPRAGRRTGRGRADQRQRLRRGGGRLPAVLR
jgi:predicted enzyme related to lactoylglutathione lyase